MVRKRSSVGKRSVEAKQRRSKKRVRKCRVEVRVDDQKRFEEKDDVTHIRKSKVVEIGTTEKNVFFQKAVFSPEEMRNLASALLVSEYREDRTDKICGLKPFYINGLWTQQGHTQPGIDCSHPAGEAGRAASEGKPDAVRDLLQPLAARATLFLQRFRADIAGLVGDMGNPYGSFHLYMASRGVSNMHRDENDLISFMFLIQSPGKGGQLEMGGTKHAIAWEIGDAILMDTSSVYHGSRAFEGDENERLVGLFIIQKTFCHLHGKILS